MAITEEQKRQIAYALLDQPNKPHHVGKTGINDSHLCDFYVGGRRVACLAVKCVDTGKKMPCIALWFNEKKEEFLDKLKGLQLPQEFYLDVTNVTPSGSGWVSFCRKGCASADEMYRHMIDPGDKRKSWISLRDTLVDWVKGLSGGNVVFFNEETGEHLLNEGDSALDVSQSFSCGVPVAADSSSDNPKLILKNGGMDPAIVQVDMMKWQQSDYADDVKELSELDPGVLSWISTVEEVAKKAAVSVKGVLVTPAKLCIPPYQRKFAWKEQDVRQLCKDLLKAGDEGNYHLGTVILHHERKNDEEIWNVVDGQQRLTNIMAILSAPIFELPIKQFLMRDYMMIRQVLADYSEDEQKKIRERLARCTLAFISVENVSEAFQLFTTQNGRGKPLTPVNLLKAYHYKAMEADRRRMDADDFDQLLRRIECEWESANVASTPGDGKLLLHVFREYLFRLRLWSRGKFPQIPFDANNIGEFKGVTIASGGQGLPLQNGAVLRTGAPESDAFVAHRLPDDNMNPFVSITQTIVNGSDFFMYAQSYVSAYKEVFVEGKVKAFYDFYTGNCKPKLHKSGAAMYARHVFEALCMFCYDRFGAEGLKACHRALFACAYFERVSQTRVLYRRCGSAYAPRAIELMMTTYSVADVQEALSELRSEIRRLLNAADYVKDLFKKTKLTRGELMQRSACETIMK